MADWYEYTLQVKVVGGQGDAQQVADIVQSQLVEANAGADFKIEVEPVVVRRYRDAMSDRPYQTTEVWYGEHEPPRDDSLDFDPFSEEV